MPGPRFTSPNHPSSKRSEALRMYLRQRYGDYGKGRRDALNRFKHVKLRKGRV